MQTMNHNVSRELALLHRDSHEVCCNCGRAFREGDTSHLGYDDAKQPLYLGDCCSHLLTQTAIRHYYTPRSYVAPPNDTVLWRYMCLGSQFKWNRRG